MPASRFAIGRCQAISAPRPAPIGKLNFAERWGDRPNARLDDLSRARGWAATRTEVGSRREPGEGAARHFARHFARYFARYFGSPCRGSRRGSVRPALACRAVPGDLGGLRGSGPRAGETPRIGRRCATGDENFPVPRQRGIPNGAFPTGHSQRGIPNGVFPTGYSQRGIPFPGRRAVRCGGRPRPPTRRAVSSGPLTHD